MKITLPGKAPEEVSRRSCLNTPPSLLPPLQGQGTSDLGTRVPAQDYEKLRRECIAKGKLFEDPYFPASDQSLFYSQKFPVKVEWRRPKVGGEGGEGQGKWRIKESTVARIL